MVEALIIGIYVLRYDKEIAFRVRDFFLPCAEQLSPYIKYSIPVIVSDLLLALGNNAVAVIMGHISTEFVAANAIIATIVGCPPCSTTARERLRDHDREHPRYRDKEKATARRFSFFG